MRSKAIMACIAMAMALTVVGRRQAAARMRVRRQLKESGGAR